MEQQIDSAVKRGRAYWFVDGFAEMGAGALFLLLGVGVLLRGWIGQEGWLSWFASAAIDFGTLKAVTLLAAVLAVWWLKDRFTYPRTGYIRGKSVPQSAVLSFLRNVLLLVILPVLGLAAAVILLPPMRIVLTSIPAWLPVGIGALWGVFSWLTGTWTGLTRFRVMGALALMTGMAVGAWQMAAGFPALPAEALQADWWTAMPDALSRPLIDTLNRMFAGVGTMTLVCGIILLASGLVTFLSYRKENPEPYREDA